MQAGVITYACILLYNRTIERITAVLRRMHRNSSKKNCPLFPDTPVFLKILLNATFPLPHGVSPIPFPLCTSFEGTHGTAPQGATLGTRIIGTFLSLCHCALCAGYATTRRSRLYYTHKASTHKRQANESVIYKMKAQSFV